MEKLTSSIFSFEKIRNENYLYVDKTEYLFNLIKRAGESFFLARPRRFGKSLAVSTFEAIFQGRKELFAGLYIHSCDYDWKKYPVIRLDLNGWGFNGVDELRRSLSGMIRECAEDHNVVLNSNTHVEMFRELIRALSANNQQVVILIDEYDKPILNNLGTEEAVAVQSELKTFYSIIKAFEENLRFAFITGVTKFSHVSLFSDLNNLIDLTMRKEFSTMLGYTQKELETNFAAYIKSIAKTQKTTQKALKQNIKEWYNGYRFHANSETVYNPVSIAQFFNSDGEFENYWFKTGTPSFLMEVAKKTNFNIENAINKPVTGISFDAFEISNIDSLTLLLQTGYLTIKSSKTVFNKTWYYLDFPNEEVAESFSTYLLNSYVDKNQREVTSLCMELTNAFLDNNLECVRKILEVFFAGIPYPLHKKTESTFHNIFFAIFRLLGFNIEAESCTNDGRIDAVVKTKSHIYLFEFKLDEDDTALTQMKEKEYFKKYLLEKKEIILIGVNFSSQKGQLIDWKTELV